MNGYMSDAKVVLSMMRDSASYLDKEDEDYMLRWLDKAISGSREFQNATSGLVSIAKNLRRR